jgi:hypothetical protein
MDQQLYRGHALGGFLSTGRTKLVIAVRLELRRSLSEYSSHAFPQLQFSLGASRIPIGKSFAAEIVNQRQDILKLFDAPCDLFDQSGLRT